MAMAQILAASNSHRVKLPLHYFQQLNHGLSTLVSTTTFQDSKIPPLLLQPQLHFALTGPPALNRQQPGMTTPAPANRFMDLMVEYYNKTHNVEATPLGMGLTENMSPTYVSTGNPCLDFFFHVVPGTPPESVHRQLEQAWEHDPLTALKLVANLRGVRGTGKTDREGYYASALWVHEHHPKTLAVNVGPLIGFGYYKDMLEILHRLLKGADVREKERELWLNRRSQRGCQFPHHREGSCHYNSRTHALQRSYVNHTGWQPYGHSQTTVETSKGSIKKPTKEEIEKGKLKSLETAKNVLERYRNDDDYRFLYDCIADFFAECLKSDMEMLAAGNLYSLSLAAKWAPSLSSGYDRSTLLCEGIARRMFPRESDPKYETMEEAHYTNSIRNRLRKEVLVPLRKALELPDVYIGTGQWNAIPYNRVASLAMKLYKELFLKRDEERFKEYLEKVEAGKAKIAAGGLLPHEIIRSLMQNSEDGGQVAELQWKRMVDDLAQNGKLKNCIAICDVSDSMNGTPMEVSVAMGVLVSELSEEPWKGKLITFSRNPKLQLVEGDDLKTKTEFVRHIEWGMNTDFQNPASCGEWKAQEDMINRVFVFSDMEFDQASSNPWETDYMAITRKFTEKGYGSVVPEIIFWNLRDSHSTPVMGNKNGVALVSGFSKNLLKLFLKDGVINPEAIMLAAISGEEYEDLMVVD